MQFTKDGKPSSQCIEQKQLSGGMCESVFYSLVGKSRNGFTKIGQIVQVMFQDRASSCTALG